MTYEEFDSAIQKLAALIRQSGFVPDALVALARGGWIPARLLSKHLGVKRLQSFGIVYEDDSRDTLDCYDEPFPVIEHKNVLLIEDYLESGKSLLFCCERMERRGNIVRTAAIGHLGTSLVVPDFSLGTVDRIPSLPWD